MLNHYDIIVIGGGHAGVEAASAAARLGASTALVTMARDAIGRMSCNPAIGGLGKGQMVREVDALGGIMGLAIDRGGIHFRMLNRSKGPAVWAPRAQADRKLYAAAVLELVEAIPNLDIIEGAVEEIHTTEIQTSQSQSPNASDCRVRRVRRMRRVSGVVLADGRCLRGSAVVVTTGTFMRGLMHCGEAQTEGGRFGEPAAIGISACLEGLGFTLARLKTGTPPRVHRDSLDYKHFERQDGESEPTPFSFLNTTIRREQVPCWITHTNTKTHDIIRANLHRAPMYSGQIDSTGPRYCPSIEDKIVRFADKPRHQIFLEPEGYDCDWVYCNGVSTSLPRDVQDAFLRTISGLERARVVQYGYAVEYDFVPTHQTRLSLEAKHVEGLFFAGQINGTSGYEEAAAQGLIAGANAALQLRGDEPLIIGRDQGYLGVMIDDIITKPPSEPYRMFTSRAEYRLSLRSDNADERLTPLARRVGLVQDDRWSLFEQKQRDVADMRNLVARTPHNGRLLAEVMKQPQLTLEHIIEVLKAAGHTNLPREALQHVLIDARYAGYLIRQDRQIERFRKMESTKIPPQADYGTMAELRVEAREKLTAVGPTTLGQASRIEGISPTDVLALSVYLAGHKRK